MKLARGLLRNTGVRTLLVVLVALAVFQAWLYIEAPGKIDPRIPPVLAQDGKANITVELNFPPERYHIQALQTFGRVGGADGNTVLLRNVTADGVQSLARTYWVRRITLTDGN